jgi:hypothetical protein
MSKKFEDFKAELLALCEKHDVCVLATWDQIIGVSDGYKEWLTGGEFIEDSTAADKP